VDHRAVCHPNRVRACKGKKQEYMDHQFFIIISCKL
jgi:hypothetical protein